MAKIITLKNEANEPVAPRTGAAAVSMASGKSLEVTLGGCWIEFTDENGTPTDVPYIHWMEEV